MSTGQKNLFFLLFIAAVALYINVGSYGVIETSDARYAEISREMYASGDYLHPNFLGIHHYHKPPFTYMITALGYHLFGVNPFGARFFLQLAILLQILLVYKLAFLLFNNKKTALWAAIIYFSFPIVISSSRMLTTDPFLTTFAILSMYAYVKYRKSNKKGFFYLFTVSLALGMLTKGPVIFIIPVAFIIPYSFTEKTKNKLGWHHLLAWLIFIILALSWYLYLVINNHDFLSYFLGRQTLDRLSSNVFNRTEPFWYFLVFGPLMGLPWILTLPHLLKKKKLFSPKTNLFALLLGILIPLIFFSLSASKRILYILPIYSLLAILIAHLLNITENRKIVNKIMLWFSLILIIILAIAPFFSRELELPIFFTVLCFLAFILLIGIYHSTQISNKYKSGAISLTLTVFLLVAGSYGMSKNELEVNSPRPVTDFIIKNKLVHRTILVYNTRKPSIAFGLNKAIVCLNDGSKSLHRETQFENNLQWKNYLIDMHNTSELKFLKKKLEKPSVLIVYKHEIHDNSKWLKNYYQNVEKIGKWKVYY
ncbi:MAG: hypothetical protein PWQ09_383 [Candidatus Cloacimonadota bacterium]|jgi:4-amino-4-deoxy-L-arabinose transferase|nr:hypothetical protein [Candidatus Cloacimonadota bacterium]